MSYTTFIWSPGSGYTGKRSFHLLTTFYCMYTLTEMLQGGKKGDNKRQWIPVCLNLFLFFHH